MRADAGFFAAPQFPTFSQYPSLADAALIASTRTQRGGSVASPSASRPASVMEKNRRGSANTKPRPVRRPSRRLAVDRATSARRDHHVEMNPVGAGGVDRPHLLAELGKIGRQDRRRHDDRIRHAPFSFLLKHAALRMSSASMVVSASRSQFRGCDRKQPARLTQAHAIDRVALGAISSELCLAHACSTIRRMRCARSRRVTP